MENIVKKFKNLQIESYKNYQKKHLPNIKENKIIGVRINEIRNIAKTLIKNDKYEEFLNELPHTYLEEDLLHCMIISELKDYEYVSQKLEIFLPFLDNWETCDVIRPKSFKNQQKNLIQKIKKWLKSNHEYTIRFAVGMLMIFFVDEYFDKKHLYMLTEIKNKEYYVKMAIAWYIQKALTKHYDIVYEFLKERKLDKWIHNKAIQKSKESFCINDKQKKDLEILKYK